MPRFRVQGYFESEGRQWPFKETPYKFCKFENGDNSHGPVVIRGHLVNRWFHQAIEFWRQTKGIRLRNLPPTRNTPGGWRAPHLRSKIRFLRFSTKPDI